ncbi:MAG: hypothetical protein HQM11_07825 [SAR324 cluster bacterium]|nr:hypothetical protein [SAR324 cluster bacterium]
MFIDITEKLIDLLDTPSDKVYYNDATPIGVAENAQFLRFSKNCWTLEIRVGFSQFFVNLQEHQAMAIIHNVSGNVFSLTINDHYTEGK